MGDAGSLSDEDIGSWHCHEPNDERDEDEKSFALPQSHRTSGMRQPMVEQVLRTYQSKIPTEVYNRAMQRVQGLERIAPNHLIPALAATVFHVYSELGVCVDTHTLAESFEVQLKDLHRAIRKYAPTSGVIEMSCEGFFEELIERLGYDSDALPILMSAYQEILEKDSPVLEEHPMVLAAAILVCKAPDLKLLEAAKSIGRTVSRLSPVVRKVRQLIS